MEVKYIYVVSGTGSEFLDYVKKNEGAEFIHLVDGDTIRGRVQGEIVRTGSYSSRWNYQDIQESIEREQFIWGNPDIENEIKDIDYGTGE